MVMNDTRKTVLDLTSIALFGNDISIPENTDWNAVFNEVKNQNIVSLLYPVIENRNIPDNIQNNWKKLRDQYLLNNARNITCHISIHQLMNKANIPYVILKGVASGVYYPNYLLRGYGDVDFLVNKDDFQKAADLLSTNGFVFTEKNEKHRNYKKNNVTYELHNSVISIPTGKLHSLFDEFFSDIIDKSVPFKHNNSICMIPSDRHNAVILLIHTAEHMSESGIGLRHLLDWAAFAGTMDDHFFIHEMLPILKEMGLWHFCCILTALCTKYLGLREFDWITDIDSEYLDKLIDDVFESGEFGNLQRNRISNSSDSNSIRSYLTFLNKRAKRLSLIKKFPILLPLGWVYLFLRYMYRIVIGTRSFKKARVDTKIFNERTEINKEWHLFEKEE